MEDTAQAPAAPLSARSPAPARPGRGAPFGADLAGTGNLVSQGMWLFFLAGTLGVIICAAVLTPAVEGHGTHTQLGLPPCGFLVATGFPCPGCGLTTSFSHMVRLQVGGALSANPFGVLLFSVTLLMVPVSFFGLLRRVPVLDALDRLHMEKIAIGLSAISLAVWLTRVTLQAIG
ncbi:MAG: DUF2752 domain-containing protein [Sandaracinaceae bacterium]